ncbi:MAG: DUF1800 family protein [Planctomycetota bacterium]
MKYRLAAGCLGVAIGLGVAGTVWAEEVEEGVEVVASVEVAAAELEAEEVEARAAVGATVRWPMGRTVVWGGVTQAVVFELTEPAGADAVLAAAVEPGGVAELVGEVRVIEGARHGVARVRGLGDGAATLTVAGKSVELVGKALPAGVAGAWSRPVVVAPTSGAAVWGEVLVAAEVFDEAVMYPGDEREVRLEVEPAGAGVAVSEPFDTGRSASPQRTLGWTLSLDEVAAGTTVRVRAIALHNGVEEASDWRAVTVVGAPADRLIVGEAEAHAQTPRPERYGERPLQVRKDERASGGAYAELQGNRPVAVALDAGEGGWYQAMAVVAADHGGGAWPTVGVRRNNENDGVTGGIAAVGDGWRRVAVGRPVWFDGGEQMAVLSFERDFYVRNKSNRNLRVDRYELLRLDQGRPGFAWGDSAEALAAAEVATADDFVVATREVWHGRAVTGDWTVAAVASATLRDGLAAPWVHLEMDGERVASQRAWRPEFTLSRGHLSDGPMRVRVVGELSDGRRAASVEQVVIGRPWGEATTPRRQYRITLDDAEAWVDLPEELVEKDNRWSRRIQMNANAAVAVRMPAGVSGRFYAVAYASGDSFEGDPELTATLIDEAGEVVTALDPVRVRGRWSSRGLGTITLDGSPKQLRLAFENDHYGGAAGKDRNLRIAGVMLRELRASDERGNTLPSIELVYPAAGAVQHDAGAVVVDLADDAAVTEVELLIDGEPTGARVKPILGRARAVLPAVWRGVEPGERAVSVRGRDASGEWVTTPSIAVRVVADEPASPTEFAQAVAMLQRFAYGPEPAVLADVLIEGPEAWLSRSLSAGTADIGSRAAWQAAAAVHNDGQVPNRATHSLLRTPNPARARLTMFIDNHLNTWTRKVSGERKAVEHARFVELGGAPFLAVLDASATGAAMLRYLDQHRSYGGRINENYAREIMELHTVGVDSSYTQQDVTELSHVLAGWRSTEEHDPSRLVRRDAQRFRFVPALNDGQARRVFGLDLPAAEPADRYDRVRRVVEALAAHPDTARYLATKLVEHYLVSPAPESLVDELTLVYLETGGDLAAVVSALAEHPYATSHDAPRLKRPIEYAVGLQRNLGHYSTWPTVNFLRRSGSGMFDHETPDGYDAEPQSYANSNAMLQRWRLAGELQWQLYALLPDAMRRSDRAAFADVPESDRKAAWAEAVVDYLAVRLNGSTLGPRSRSAAIDALLAAVDGSGNTSEFGRTIAVLVAQLPESQQQ